MIYEALEGLGLNGGLFTDLIICVLGVGCFFSLMVFSRGKGIIMPLIVKPMFGKQNAAIIDLGGIETPIVNYPKGSKELRFKYKDNEESWTIPAGIERLLPNNTKYVLANSKIGSAYYQAVAVDIDEAERLINSGEAINIQKAGDILTKVRTMLSPKAQANVIDDRSKQLAEAEVNKLNKTVLYGAAVAIVLVAAVGMYLIVQKVLEYNICMSVIQGAKGVITTTTTLPPL